MAIRPTHTVYTVRDYKKGEEKDAEWLKIGVAWLHKDGKGFDLDLQATPIDGRAVVRLNDRKKPGLTDD